MSPFPLGTEDTEHYFCKTPMNNLNYINTAIASLNPNDLLIVIVYRLKGFNKKTNCKILTAIINFIKDITTF